VNPPGDESEVSEYVSEKLSSMGLDIELVEPKTHRVNTLATLRGIGQGRNFLFNGHYDTVPVGSLDFWSLDPYAGVIKDGKLYGRGAGDMKGAIASAILAVKVLVELGIQLKGDMLIHAVADEETGSKYGTRYLIEKGYVSTKIVDMAVVGEASVFKDRIYARTAVRGLHWFKIITKGKSVHSSRPQEGVNAVLKMCKILLALNEHNFNFIPHQLLPNPNIAPGTVIKGGTKENIIPDLCEAICDIRVVPGMTMEDTLQEVREIIESLKKKDPDIEAEVLSHFWWPPSEISTSEEIFKIARNAVDATVNYELMPRGTSGSNDTPWLTNIANIPTFAFGPGDNYMSGAHGPDEWISINRMIDFTKIYGLMAMDICGVED
jgi:acetylornithine deacetylase/succinyl-diaminopimelate desuccinylase family protein